MTPSSPLLPLHEALEYYLSSSIQPHLADSDSLSSEPSSTSKLLHLEIHALPLAWTVAVCSIVLCWICEWPLGTSRIPMSGIVVLALLALTQGFIVVVATKQLLERLVLRVEPVKILCVFRNYNAAIAAFVSWYMLAVAIEPQAVKRPPHDLRDDHLPGLFIQLMYFSTSTITSSGLGDLTANSITAQAISLLQMLLGIVYVVGVFAVALRHLQAERSMFPDEHRGSLVRRRTRVQRVFRFLRRRVPLVERGRRFVIHHMLSVSIALTLINMSVLLITSTRMSIASSQDMISVSIVGGVQAIQMLIIAGMCFRLARQYLHKVISPRFLLQGYISTALGFSGVYFAMEVTSSGAAFAVGSPDAKLGLVLWRLIYMSVAIQTSTGYGDYTPVSHLAMILVCLHMLASVLFSVVVFGLGLSKLIEEVGEVLEQSSRQASPSVSMLHRSYEA